MSQTPAGLLAAALVFWGWQTGFLVVALVMAVVLEGRHVVRARWDLSRATLNRVSDASALFLGGVAVYQAIGNDAAHAVLGLLQWLPVVLFPLVTCQVYSASGAIDVSIFFWTLRRRARAMPERGHPAVDLTHAYVALAVLAASAANVRGGVFFAGSAILAAWALAGVRARRYGLGVWGAAVLAAVALGWAGQVGLEAAQRALERATSAWLLELISRDTDPFRTSTSLGQVGEVKLSSRIEIRVETDPGVRPPPLLREAVYNVYNAPAWYAVDAPFQPVQPETDGITWRLGPPDRASGAATVAAYLARGHGVLPVPSGSLRLDDLYVVRLGRSRLGAVRAEEGLGLVRYGVHFTGVGRDGPPTRLDLAIPPSEAAGVAHVAGLLGLEPRSPADALLAIRAFLAGFRYTRYLGERPPGASALQEFLLRTRSGHCEYFATATVLLLRAAGVPARYAVGHAVHEWSPLERRWVVRASDAHAWALAWIGGAWRDVDTTPPDWTVSERGAASLWRPLHDVGSWLSYLLSRWRWSERQDHLVGSIGWLLVPLLALLGWRMDRRRRRGGTPRRVVADVARRRPGDDSEFYLVERRLAALTFPRAPGEPVGRWLQRVEAARPPAVVTEGLRSLVTMHYRHRFDPRGLGESERATLADEARAWLDAHADRAR